MHDQTLRALRTPLACRPAHTDDATAGCAPAHAPARGPDGVAGVAVLLGRPCSLPVQASAEAVHALQRSIGNAAVVRLLGARSAAPAAVGADRASASAPAPVQRSAVPGVVGSPGRALNASLRREMEARFGADFGDVRVHDDAAAARSAAEVGAGAYTCGRHVVIGAGGHDRYTLAHELTHVLQQRSGAVAGRRNSVGLKVSDPSDRFERGAEANARRVMRRGPGAASDDSGTATRERAAGARAAQPIVQRRTALLSGKDPAKNDTTPRQDWPTLVSVVQQGHPTAVDVHRVTDECATLPCQAGRSRLRRRRLRPV